MVFERVIKCKASLESPLPWDHTSRYNLNRSKIHPHPWMAKILVCQKVTFIAQSIGLASKSAATSMWLVFWGQFMAHQVLFGRGHLKEISRTKVYLLSHQFYEPSFLHFFPCHLLPSKWGVWKFQGKNKPPACVYVAFRILAHKTLELTRTQLQNRTSRVSSSLFTNLSEVRCMLWSTVRNSEIGKWAHHKEAV